MIEQHELALAILKWIGILTLPVFYVGLYFAIRWADRQEAIAMARDSAANEDLPVLQDCQARAASIAPDTSA